MLTDSNSFFSWVNIWKRTDIRLKKPGWVYETGPGENKLYDGSTYALNAQGLGTT